MTISTTVRSSRTRIISMTMHLRLPIIRGEILHRDDNSVYLLYFYSLVLYVNNEHIVTDVYLNDGYWHHVCAYWESLEGSYGLYVDGVLKQNDTGLATMTHVTGKYCKYFKLSCENCKSGLEGSSLLQ